MVYLGWFATARLAYLVVDWSHLLCHFIGTLPRCQESVLCGGDQEKHFIPGQELTRLGTSVIHFSLGFLGLSHVLSDHGPNIFHMRLHRLYMLNQAPMGA